MTGAYAFTPSTWLPLAAALFLAALSIYSWRHRRVPGAQPLAIGSLFATLWLLGIFMELAAADAETKIAWRKFQTVWQLAGVSATTCFVLEYTHPGRPLNRRLAVALAIPPVMVLAIVVLGWDALLWRGLTVTADGALATQRAPLTSVLLSYGLGLIVINGVAFVMLFIRSPQHRWPIAIMLAGEIISRVLWLLGIAKVPRIDADVMAILLVWGAYAVALFGFRILDPLGAARLTVIRQMREGMVVFDNQWRAVSVNPAAERILGARGGQLRGKSWEQLLPNAAPPPDADAATAAPAEITLGAGEQLRSYAMDLSPLMDARGLRAGSLLLLLDITEQRHAQIQAEAQQRALAVLTERERIARELHDSAGQVLAFVNTQGQATRRVLARGNVELADEYLARLIEVAQEADTDLRESILGLRVALTEQGLAQALGVYLDQYQRRYGIRAELVGSEALAGTALEPFVEVQMLRIVQEALTNARKHSGAASVRVALERDAARIIIAIRDDGCGFDADELREREGVGLRVMRERAKEVGGDLAVRSTPGEGATIAVTVPAQQVRARSPHMEGDRNARIAGG